ncbi:RDD family protein [Luteolibacter sp. LG18]|uniref:RDD family protein n=1 Tax=Luteolibacter sp. LG18 TaxID=2819286 RepID=UPI002B2FF5BC|nr:hypothetical protein llg_04630 [Luteolibacter sp. LG18]
MDFWIIREGEKAGPFPDYEIRRKIESGELSPADPVWSEGMAAWTPVGEVEMFRVTLERPPVLPPPLPAHAIPAPPVWRRFLARMFDLALYLAVLWSALAFAKVDLKAAIESVAVALFHLVPWFALEAGLIHWFATTPGKALMGLRVLNRDGSRLSFRQSFRRAALVLTAGVGMGFSLLFPLCMAVSWVSVRRIGASLWDFAGDHQTVVSEPKAFRIVAFVVLFIAALQVQALILTPVTLEMMPPWFREAYEKSQHR